MSPKAQTNTRIGLTKFQTNQKQVFKNIVRFSFTQKNFRKTLTQDTDRNC